MFSTEALDRLSCPTCGASFQHKTFDAQDERSIREALVWCARCRAWFPLEGGVLDLLMGELAYADDRRAFAARHAADLRALDLVADPSPADKQGESALQSKQQAHFDWYAANEKQSYLEYEQMPFWEAVDAITFAEWRPRFTPGSWLLDVGCGNGRSTFKVADLDLNVLAFDVSKGAIRQAEERARAAHPTARLSFLVADARRFPIKDAVMDHVLIYGVLHHVPDPREACREVARVLKSGGVYFGSENNETIFRAIFDKLQKLKPLWYEEAGPEALISDTTVRQAFASTGVSVSTRSSIFVPPHLINLLPRQWGPTILRVSDRLGRAVPGVSSNGGLIVIEGVKDAAPTASAR
jgi:SAM-dependent methyltransferase